MLAKRISGSITIEAALALPIFLFSVLFFLLFFHLFYIHNVIQISILDAAREVSQEMYKKENIIDLSQYVKKHLSYHAFPVFCLEGGRGGILSSQSTMDGNRIDVIVSYKMIFPVPFFGEQSLSITQKVRTRGTVGVWQIDEFLERNTSNLDSMNKIEENHLVYMAENGVVYHTNPECSHIKLQIKSIVFHHIDKTRNHTGGTYSACHLCVQDEKIVDNYIDRKSVV